MSIGAPYRTESNYRYSKTGTAYSATGDDNTEGGANVTLTLADADFWSFDCGGGHRSMVLPAATTVGAKVVIANASDAAENITVQDSDASTTNGVVGQNEVGTFIADGTKWQHFTGVA
jgi:hypothetical protein|tara:strand:+ start:12001 stop:12354 length:354 start_codon:yes stop_codon:yes gene_type:complete